MKINGKNFSNDGHIAGPFPIERTVTKVDPETKEETTERVVYGIYAQPVWSYADFDRLYPSPQPPVNGWSPTGEKAVDVKDSQYLEDVKTWENARTGWSIMKSLEPSKIELDGVDMADPKTWHLILERLRGSDDGSTRGMFSYFEYNKIMGLMDQVCGIDDDKIRENRKSFLSGAKPAE